MPKHRNTFTAAEYQALRVLVDHLRGAAKKDRDMTGSLPPEGRAL